MGDYIWYYPRAMMLFWFVFGILVAAARLAKQEADLTPRRKGAYPMKLSNLWKEKEVTLSFEAFPPKKDSDFASVAIAVEKIAQLKPDFMSVTYGAMAGTLRLHHPDRPDRPGPGSPPWPT